MDYEQLEAQHLTDTEDIYRVLKSLELNRSLLTVTLAGGKQLASSMLLETRLETRNMLIDQLNDDAMQQALKPGSKILLRSAYGGVQVSGECEVIKIHEPTSGTAVELAFPTQLQHRQRRAVYRASLTTQQPHIDLQSSRRKTDLQGCIIDVSAEGLGVEFSRFVHPPIEPGEFFESAHFLLNSEAWVLSLTAKHPTFDRQTDKYRCGFSFHHLNKSQSKSINQWVLQIQRNNQSHQRSKLNSSVLKLL